MCQICSNIRLQSHFFTPDEYLKCLKYIQQLVDTGDFEFCEKTCDTDRVKNENGCWVDDVICHVIKCKYCGQCYSCCAVTYRGGGSFRKGR